MLASVLELLPKLKSTYFASMNPPNERYFHFKSFSDEGFCAVVYVSLTCTD